MLSTAEAILGLSRHLSAYSMGPERAALGQLEFAGKLLELVFRLRGSGVSPLARVAAMALDAGISKRDLEQSSLPALETLALVDLSRDASGRVELVSERIPPESELGGQADAFLQMAMPDPVERAVLKLLDLTTTMPVTRDVAMSTACEVASEEDAERAVRYLEALHLCSSHETEDGATVLFNPNIWSVNADYAKSALVAEDGKARAALSGLLEEVASTAGLPQDQVTSCEPKWINFAVAHGLLQRSLVVTTGGTEKAFLFAPHMGRSPFAQGLAPDLSGHVRQLIGSMVFAKNYASTRLFAPTIFLRRLIRDGEAGDASAIASDYPMLEKAGVVRVEPARRFHKLVLLQPDVAENAVQYLNDTAGAPPHTLSFRDQSQYIPPELERARRRTRLAREADSAPEETKRLIAALRQEIGNRRYDR